MWNRWTLTTAVSLQEDYNEIGQELGVHPTQVGMWTKELRRECGPPQSGMVYGHHAHPSGARFVYLVAVIDWYSRKVLSWRLLNTLKSGFYVDCLEQAYGTPEISTPIKAASSQAKHLLSCC